MPKNWDDMTIEEQLQWARGRLRELAESADNQMVQSVAAKALAGNLSLELSAKAKVETKESPASNISHDRAYLEAVQAEVAAKLLELDKVKS